MDSLLSLANVRPNQAAYWCGDEFTFHNDTGQLSEVRQVRFSPTLVGDSLNTYNTYTLHFFQLLM